MKPTLTWRRVLFALVATLCATMLFGSGCSGCERESFVAELVDKSQQVERDFARAKEAWSEARRGDRLDMGDALRTGSQAQATLRLAQDGRLLVKSDTIVRFVQSFDNTQAEPALDVLQGELTIESGDQQLSVHTPRGMIKVDHKSTVRVRSAQDVIRFDVDVGRVEYTLNGVKHTSQAGEGFELEVLDVSVEAQAKPSDAGATTEPEPDSDDDDTEEPPAATEAAQATATQDTFEPSPEAAIVRFSAGETITIHDPSPPTDVAVTAKHCDHPLVLELDRRRSRAPALRFRGQAEVLARVARGTYTYRVRCTQAGRSGGKLIGGGQLRVVADAATRPLPLSPVTITADADGRRYTVSYQNQLPTITLRWPYAPHATGYHLVVQPAHGEPLHIDSAKADVTLSSGRLGEGLHRFWFETPDHKRSEKGSLQVSFDYTARAAYLTSPREGETWQSDSAQFAGGTLLGSRVHVQGELMRLDAHGRFTTTVNISPELTGAAVRVSHPSAGVHYYVRHSSRHSELQAP